jgi:hypothetical protein
MDKLCCYVLALAVDDATFAVENTLPIAILDFLPTCILSPASGAYQFHEAPRLVFKFYTPALFVFQRIAPAPGEVKLV